MEFLELEDIEAALQDITDAAAEEDFERAHQLEIELHHSILHTIANLSEDAFSRNLALTGLKSLEIRFTRPLT